MPQSPVQLKTCTRGHRYEGPGGCPVCWQKNHKEGAKSAARRKPAKKGTKSAARPTRKRPTRR